MRLFRSLWMVLCCFSGTATAAAFQVSPTRLQLSATQATDALTLTNTSDAPTTLQITVFAWSQVDGQDVLSPTTDAVAVPPLITLAPGTRQLVRVALRQRTVTPVERSYRLILQQLPSPTTPSATSGAVVLLRLSLPLFVPAQQPSAPQAVWTITPTPAGFTLTLRNTGNSHLQVKRLSLHVPSTLVPLLDQDVFGYVLPGQTFHWTFPVLLPDDLKATNLLAETDRGVLRATLALQP